MKRQLLLLTVMTGLFFGCSSPSSQAPTTEERVEELLSQLTLEEKISLMIDASAPVERLGIKPFHWWNEALHGVARAGLATVFPQPIGMAASFDSESVYDAFNAVSDEARAKNTRNTQDSLIQRFLGLTMWTPNINIFRDPRWGRGMETYGEDPYLTAVLGSEVVRGLQGPADSDFDKLHACAKHFAVHSGPEWNRHSFNAENVALRDLYETYLPAFKTLVQDAGVKEVMCAYNRFEGEPCCGSHRLLTDILRNDWGFEGIVVSDCGAIYDFYWKGGHRTHPDPASASADALLSGTDLNCGTSYRALKKAVADSLVTEQDIDVSVRRLLQARFELGEMDDLEAVSWSKIPYSVVASAAHNQLALRLARQSMTLLYNKDNALPLEQKGITIAVVGPNANDSIMQWGNYHGTPPSTTTILQGIQDLVGTNGTVIYAEGCGLTDLYSTESIFDQVRSEGKSGFSARYWNNRERSGEPVYTGALGEPFNLRTTEDQPFAPGVNLSGFAATYNGTWTAEASGEVVFDFYSYGKGKLFINKEEVKKYSHEFGAWKTNYVLNAEKGKTYDIQVEFEDLLGDAQLNFDISNRIQLSTAHTLEKVKEADVVVFVGGLSAALEGEDLGVHIDGFKGGDRLTIELPKAQKDLFNQLYDPSGKRKLVMVNCSGSAIALSPFTDRCDAILQAWYPGQAGGQAVAEVLFGDYNPAGRLPVTFYDNDSQLRDFEDYAMAGRTYRFLEEDVRFPFGYGLSYTTFSYGVPKVQASSIKTGETLRLSIPVTNTGDRDGEEVIQVYLRKENDSEGAPAKTLRSFKRMSIPQGKTVTVELELNAKQLEWWDEATQTVRTHAGNYTVLIGGSSREADLQSLPISLN